MSPGHSAPGGSAQATIPLRQLPAAAFHAAAYASGNCCFAATSARRRARPINRDYRSPGIGPGHRARAEDLHAGRKSSGVPLAPLGLPGATRLAPYLGSAGCPMGTVTIGHPAALSRLSERRRYGSPPGKPMLSAENIENSPLNALRPGHAGGEARPQDAPGQAASRVRGGAPAAPSPPRGARGPAPP